MEPHHRIVGLGRVGLAHLKLEALAPPQILIECLDVHILFYLPVICEFCSLLRLVITPRLAAGAA
ncbi:MAG: hypothetical protein WDA14_14200 [Sphaerochaetaceae bacterium]